jgi:DNA-binding beta-propeller fold protein YncE
VTTQLIGPQGFVNPGGNAGYSAILDVQSSGAATLYYGNSGEAGWSVYNLGWVYEPADVWGYGFGATAFNNPKGMTADVPGNIYIADTGNGYVEQFIGTIPLHLWGGNAGVTFNNGGGANFVTVAFKSPYALACDTANPANVWVGDVGYAPSVVQEFSSGGTTITAGFQTIAGCVIHGIAINPNNGFVYVADAGLNQVEVYYGGGAWSLTATAPPIGTLLCVLTDPHSVYEGGRLFAPSCIAFDTNSPPDLWVSDTNNDLIMSFQ